MGCLGLSLHAVGAVTFRHVVCAKVPEPNVEEKLSIVPKRPRKFLSLFSGCGGLDYGFHANGFRCLGAFDSDPIAVKTYNQNFGDGLASVLDVSDWRSPAVFDQPDLILAGPPCQGFSPAGTFNSNDPRNCLLLVPIEVGIQLKAPLIIIENVPGVAMDRHSRIWRRVQRELASAGYVVSVQVIKAAELGVPQIRRRVVLIASKTDTPPLMPRRRATKSIGDVLKSNSGSDALVLRRGSRSWLIANRIKEGQKLCNVRKGLSAVHTWQIPEVFGSVSSSERDVLEAMIVLRRRFRVRDYGDADPVRLSVLRKEVGSGVDDRVRRLVERGYLRRATRTSVDLTHTFNGKFRRLSAGAPSHAVLTKFCDPSHFLHPYENRGFSPREAARIQSFPDDFVFLGSVSQQVRQIANAVPPLVSSRLAEWADDIL